MSDYRGRFAPTPSGPLHLGSLLTALASWLQARHRSGQWQLRMDDLDTPRCPPGMDREILRQLQAHGLTWDGDIRYQSAHLSEYQETLAGLIAAGATYPCRCTRAELARSSRPGPDHPVYSGHCRARNTSATAGPCSLRLQIPALTIRLNDGIQGMVERQLELEIGDFIIRRSDGQFAYQLACAVDESAMAITEVVRGIDLLGSTFQQIHLLQRLGMPTPRYLHLPVIVDHQGRKLSKQNHAAALTDVEAPANLHRCLELLGQDLPSPTCTQAQLLEQAARSWDPGRIPRTAQISI